MGRPRLNRKTIRISISVEEKMYSDVVQLAGQSDVSVAWLVRKAVAEMLDKHRDEISPQLSLLATHGGPDIERTT
jgi:predicted DNA-binding ribbon-helix-helix protein